MKRALLLLLLPLALAACSPDLSPEAAREAAYEAEAASDVRAALRYYKAAAEGGDLGAMQTLAEAYERGHHRARGPVTRDGEDASRYMAIVALPGQARFWRGRYERERDERAFGGDPGVLLSVAQDLDRRGSTPAERDSARAIRQRLLDAKHTPAMVGEALRTMKDDSLRAFALLEEATDLGSAQACLLQRVLVHAREGYEHVMAQQRAGIEPTTIPAAMEARHIDEIEACPNIPTDRDDMGAQVVIRQLRERGTPEAGTRLDSLRILGVFERHPHLDPATLS